MNKVVIDVDVDGGGFVPGNSVCYMSYSCETATHSNEAYSLIYPNLSAAYA